MRNQPVTKLELKKRLYRRRFVVPNAVTVGNLFCGFLTIIYAATGRFEKAVVAILIALLLDGLDGRVARRLNATSKFGVEFDSFSDLVSFGVAPAMLLYFWAFQVHADEFGVFVGFVYTLCAAGRLARFNISEENLSGFEGLASPAAASLLASVVYLLPNIEQGSVTIFMGTTILLTAGYLMVCRIPYRSIKKLRFDNLSVPGLVAIGIGIALIWYMPKAGFVLLSVSYAMSGPVLKILEDRGRYMPE